MSSAAYLRMLSLSASTKRAPAISGGKRGAAVAFISSLKISPLDPVDENVQRRYSTGTGIEVYQTFCGDGLDIKEGDILVYAAKEYAVRSVGNWMWVNAESYLRLIIEEQKTP